MSLHDIIDIFLHLDRHLNSWAGAMGGWLYVLLFVIVFCETGLVVTPFLPGDSLLFAVGALTSTEGAVLNIYAVGALLITAAVMGDAVNYAIGTRFGTAVFTREDSWLLNKKHLIRTQKFYERHGGKTIILARFMPIIRTFAPFVAGIGQMSYARFSMFNVTGALLWVISFLTLGRQFGQLETVKRNFHVVIVGIVILSVLPGVVEYLRHRGQPDLPDDPAR